MSIGSARGFLHHFAKHPPLFDGIVKRLVGVERRALEIIGDTA
jgi:hypothetical protein